MYYIARNKKFHDIYIMKFHGELVSICYCKLQAYKCKKRETLEKKLGTNSNYEIIEFDIDKFWDDIEKKYEKEHENE